jgi:hypothetical protein
MFFLHMDVYSSLCWYLSLFQMEDMTAATSVIGTEIMELSSPLYKCPDPDVLVSIFFGAGVVVIGVLEVGVGGRGIVVGGMGPHMSRHGSVMFAAFRDISVASIICSI